MRKIKTVPSFFQSDTPSGHKNQARWLIRYLGLKHDFFAKVINVKLSLIKNWLKGKENLDQFQEEKLDNLWHMFLHMFSLMNYDYLRVKTLFEAKSSSSVHPSCLMLWSGQSIQHYLENGGSTAINDVNKWLTSFRFA